MPRPLRLEFEGAICHVRNRGDRREPIFRDDADRNRFLESLGDACTKTEWQVHALCLMGNHFHLVVETPQANVVAGMAWFLGTYTSRFNRRHKARWSPVERPVLPDGHQRRCWWMRSRRYGITFGAVTRST